MKKMGKLIWIGVLFIVVGILAGCATTAKVKETKALPVEKTENFVLSSVNIEVVDKTPKQDGQKFVQKIEEYLKLELSKNEIQVEKEAEKTLKVSIKRISIVNPARRFIPLVGVFGQSTIEADVSLLDKDGSSLTSFQVSSMAGIRGALFELDAIERITRKLAQEIVNRLKALNN